MTIIACKRENLNLIPSTIGIYLFMNNEEILYIGKSVNLKARVSSHFEMAKVDPREKAFVEGSDKIKLITFDSEFKALLHESALIQKHQPRYNRIWRDDKSYLYIKINLTEKYPGIHVVRKEKDGHSLYFGPFHSTRTVEHMLKEIRRIFPFCQQKENAKRTCFYSKIKLCDPCPAFIESLENRQKKKKLRLLYRSQIRKIINLLKGKTDPLIKHLKEELQTVIEKEEFEAAICLRNRIFKLQTLLTERRMLDYDLTLPLNIRLSEMALSELLTKYFPDLKSIHRIECFDVSNIGQKISTGSMVVLSDGLIDKKEYRRFKIKTPGITSDFKMISEVIGRRFGNKWPLPDLVVVDGGKPQVRVVLKILQKINKQIPVLGIAKDPDRLIIGSGTLETVKLPITNTGFNLIRLVRDESHRFAKKYHILLRRKKLI